MTLHYFIQNSKIDSDLVSKSINHFGESRCHANLVTKSRLHVEPSRLCQLGNGKWVQAHRP